MRQHHKFSPFRDVSPEWLKSLLDEGYLPSEIAREHDLNPTITVCATRFMRSPDVTPDISGESIMIWRARQVPMFWIAKCCGISITTAKIRLTKYLDERN